MACKASWLEHLRISGKPRRQITTSKKALHIQPLLGLWPQIWRALLLSFQPGFANPWVSASTRLPLNLQWKQPNTILKLQDWEADLDNGTGTLLLFHSAKCHQSSKQHHYFSGHSKQVASEKGLQLEQVQIPASLMSVENSWLCRKKSSHSVLGYTKCNVLWSFSAQHW